MDPMRATLTALACLTFFGCGELEQQRDDGLTVDYDAGSAYVCNKCVADAQCMVGMLCMYTKDADGADAGSFCLYRRAEQPRGDCAAADPFTDSEAGWTSVDGVRDVVCRHPTLTCTDWVSSVWD